MTGWYRMNRGWMNHESFQKVPYSEREAWIWLIENAVYKGTVVNIGGAPVELQRGQLSYSIRYLAQAWSWNKGKVERFLKKRKTWSQIETYRKAGQQVINICNYSEYQGEQGKSETEVRKRTGHEHDTNETNKKKAKNLEKEKNLLDDFEIFWKSYPQRGGSNPKEPAKQKYFCLVKDGNNPTDILQGAQKYAAEIQNGNKENTPFVVQTYRWLEEKRWQDDYHLPRPSVNEHRVLF